ncbi:hypothetical protein LXA43DRAFT_1082565 [Ganoderma leucocontextum]|nr:hypothetical protein LXA43DRAFT_1082565 [Ganoderma leucocontextum]
MSSSAANANGDKLSLSKNNWPEWSQRIRRILNVSGGSLASHLTGQVVCPDENDHPAEFAHWVSNDMLIRTYCETFAEGEDLRVIQNSNSANAMWTALEECHVKQGAYAQVLFLRDLLATCFDMSKPLDMQAHDVVDLSECIVAMGNLSGDSLGIVALLHCLSPNLNHIVNQLINDQSKAKDTLTCEHIITCLHGGAEGQQDGYLARQKRDKKPPLGTPAPSSSSSSSSSAPAAPGKKVFRDFARYHVYPLASPGETALSAFSSLGNCAPLTTEATLTNDPASVPDWVRHFDDVALAAVALVADGICPWYLDSGALTHLSPVKTDFVSLRPIAPHAIHGVNGSTIHATAVGTVWCSLSNGRSLELVDALYVSAAAICLISIRALCDGQFNYSFTFSHSGVTVRSPSGHVVFEASRHTQTMFTLDPTPLVSPPLPLSQHIAPTSKQFTVATATRATRSCTTS